MLRLTSGEILASVFLIKPGVQLLAVKLGLLAMSWNVVWPVILIMFGGRPVFRALSSSPLSSNSSVSWGFGSFRWLSECGHSLEH